MRFESTPGRRHDIKNLEAFRAIFCGSDYENGLYRLMEIGIGTLAMVRRKFSFDDQMAFAALSGDYNPLHVDSVAARRLIFGHPVVHGVHAFLWALDNWLGDHRSPLDLCAVRVVFRSAIGVDETVHFAISGEGKNHVEIGLATEAGNVARIYVDWVHWKSQICGSLPTKYPERGKCRILTLEEAATASGSIDLYLNPELAAKLFPNLARRLTPIQVAEILATTRLVGMECPGLNSMYSELNLVFSTEADGPPVLTYKVTSCDMRFSLLSMKIEAPRMEGVIKAFLRPVPQKQASFADLRKQVNDGEFIGQRALIIGGSRGLGEVTAKLLTAGGADVKITYQKGSEDAQRLVDEIVFGGGSAACLPFDIFDQPQNFAEKFDAQWIPNCLYYFATPFIFMATKGSFSSQLFQKFCDYYVTGFLNTVQTVSKLGAGLQKIFYPSSVAIDELPPDMGEYAAAKMAGEILCTFLEKNNPDIIIHKPRLPRTATDQTATLFQVNNEDPVPLMLENLHCLRDA